MGKERRFEVGRRALLALLTGMVLFGLALTILDNRALPGPFRAALNASLFGRPELPPNVVVYHRFLHALLGATIASWALALALVVHYALAERRRWAWWCVASSTLIWFVPDTTASLHHGAWPNALFNLVCLVTLAVPLALTYGGLETAASATPSR